MNHKHTVPYVIDVKYLSQSWKSEYHDKYSNTNLKYIKKRRVQLLKIKQHFVPF